MINNSFIYFSVKDTVDTVKKTISGSENKVVESNEKAEKFDQDTNKIFNNNMNPMGDKQDRDPVLKPQKPLSKATEELQKKGAKSKEEEDSFNLM